MHLCEKGRERDAGNYCLAEQKAVLAQSPRPKLSPRYQLSSLSLHSLILDLSLPPTLVWKLT
jgi:hypothetical protein